MRLFALTVAAALLAAPAFAQDAAHRALAQEVAAAERAFDADTHQRGFTAGFMEAAAPDGVLFRPEPVNAREYLQSRPVSTDTHLRWGPYRIGVAGSGDLAWDTGPWTYGDNQAHGWFFTIWARQPDGSWKWAFDHGSGSTPARVPVPAPGEELVDAPGLAGDDAWAEVQALDRQVGERLTVSMLADAYRGHLAADAWVNTPDAGPAMNPQAVAAALAARPAHARYEPLGGSASQAGDLAYVYGRSVWAEDGVEHPGHFIRVWRRDAEGWRIVYDQFSPVTP